MSTSYLPLPERCAFEQLGNYVRCVITHEGAEKAEGSRRNLPSTAQQKDLVHQSIRDILSANGQSALCGVTV